MAVEREVFEELDVYGESARLASGVYVVPREGRDPVRLSFYLFTIADDAEPLPVTAIGLGWFTAAEVRCLLMAPGNVLFRDRLCAMLA